MVALFTRAWIEMPSNDFVSTLLRVALFTRAWIEMLDNTRHTPSFAGRPLHEGVD